MNRRKFSITLAASVALLGDRAMAQRSSRSGSSTILVSELTGGEVDISATTLELNNQHIDDADGSEHFHFLVDGGGQFDIYFWPQESGDAKAFTDSLINMWFSVMPDAELVDSDEYDDGGWFAFKAGNVGYYEYQLNAYEGHDLLILFNADENDFADYYEQAQAILIDGMPPFLFSEESDILAIAASFVTGSNTTTTSTRSTRGSRSSSTNQSTSAGDAVEAVRNHHADFTDSYDEFFRLLAIAADDSSSDREVADAFAAMLNVALEWQNYPTTAAEVEFSAEDSDLETAYLDWADCIGDLGTTFESFYLGDATVDDLLDLMDELDILEEVLLAILEDFAGVSLPRMANQNARKRSMLAMTFAV